MPIRVIGFLFLVGFLMLPLRADYLKNTDLKQDSSCWRGDGERVLLKADGTEGTEADTDATPVLKLALSSSQPRVVFQEFDSRDKPTTMHMKIDVFASSDFKRSAQPDMYNVKWTGGTYYWTGAVAVIPVDFWIRGGGGRRWFYRLGNLTPGSWATVDGHFENLVGMEEQLISFCVPPGKGTIYLKNPVAEPGG